MNCLCNFSLFIIRFTRFLCSYIVLINKIVKCICYCATATVYRLFKYKSVKT